MGGLEIGDMTHLLLRIHALFVIILGCLSPSVLAYIAWEYARWPHKSTANTNGHISIRVQIDGLPVKPDGGLAL
jgi:hypothetical protein